MALLVRLVFGLAAVIVALEFFLLMLFTGSDSELEPIQDIVHKHDGMKLQRIIVKSAKEEKQPEDFVPNGISIIPKRKPWEGVIHVSAVVCGQRTEEATTMLKTATLFTKRTLSFHIMAEDNLHQGIKDILDQWPCVQNGQVGYKVYSLSFPEGERKDEWKKLFKPCAAQRLFLPGILKDVDSLLYMDTDTLLLCPIEKIWNHFSRFNSTQLAAMCPEGEVPSIGWYNRFARHPYYGKLGLNSGVMLMNLTRMRAIDWQDQILPIYRKYRYDITWGDQDILNILFHYKPELLYVYGCEWNLRPDHCMYGINCQASKQNGIAVLHGNRGTFHNNKQPVFKAVYETLRDFKHGSDMRAAIAELEKKLDAQEKLYCGEIRKAVLKYPKHYLSIS